jgi:uncharacterized protein involved in oxidation of intracellular sulfur
MSNKVLFVLNDPPYGTERSYNALRLAIALGKREGAEIRVYLIGDAVGAATANQKVPNGYYHLDRMVENVAQLSGEDVACCGSCLDARGIAEDMLAKGARRSTLDQFVDWTLWADKVVAF